MLGFNDYAQFFIAMLAIVDPLTILPLYLQLVRRFDDVERARLARRAATAVTIALVFTVFLGQQVLHFFGISIGSFQIAGGLLLLMVALQLMYQNEAQIGNREDERPTQASEVVVPLAIPLLAGPGAFSTVIVFSFRSNHWLHEITLAGCLLVLGLIVWLSLHLSGRIMRFISPLSLSVVNKVMGLIMAAIAVEFIMNGIKRIFDLL